VKPLMDATFKQAMQQPEAQSYGRQGYAYGTYLKKLVFTVI